MTVLEMAEDEGQGEAAPVLRMWVASQRLAFASGSHARLGADSPLCPLLDLDPAQPGNVKLHDAQCPKAFFICTARAPRSQDPIDSPPPAARYPGR
eukprot:COSAG04_NODE_93_length_26686_cov_10.174364_12_plen_96_part_00